MLRSSTVKYLDIPTWLRWSLIVMAIMFGISALALITQSYGYITLPSWVREVNDALWPFWTFGVGYELGVRGVIRKLRKRFSL